MKTSRRSSSIKIFDGFVGKVPKYVTFTSRYCNLKGKLIDVGKISELQDGLLKDKMDTWNS